MTSYGTVDERTPLTKTAPPDYVYMTNPNRLYRKQVHQFQCCICMVVLTILTVALAITVLYSVDEDTADLPPVPDLPVDNASLQLLLSKSWPLPDDGVPVWQIVPPTPDEVESAVATGKASLTARDGLEASNPGLPVNSPSYRHQVSIKTSARATYLARSAYVMEVATKTFVLHKVTPKPKNLTKSVGRGPSLSASWLPLAECGEGPLPPCPLSEYRTIDGSCNNLYKPNKWGVAMRPYRRQLTSSYADGISKPRVASDGSELPSARAVSVTVHRPAYRDDPKFTVMLAVWGQFMDHDVTATANSVGAGGKPISCCQNTSSPAHPECFPVFLSEDDPYYQQFGITCMEFVRSAPAPTCAMGPREQMNQVSSFLDGSVVYGNTPELSRSLRSYQGGQLKMLETPDGRSLLPISTNLEDGCNREAENAKGRYCFMTGDFRANENTHLTSLHLLMARQHNLLASQMADLNPDWSDEKLYQEARKVVGAQMQHITYNEFLPVLLGPEMMSHLDLDPQATGYYKDYDPSVDATISNNFATSAFRFAHTLLPALMKTVAKDWGSEESVEMHKMLFDPFKLYQTGALDKVLQGAISTKLERADSYFNTQVTQHLFQASGEDATPTAPRYGLDLVSLNVQRGRDHGLPGYPVWREYCGLSRPKTFADMEGMVDEGSLERIKSMYKSVDDIDMYTGALSEFPIEGGLVGPTITCLVSDQFKRLKQGDSFWYETDKKPQAFTLGQLNELRKTTLASIICDTSDEVTMVQPQVMKSVGPTNARVPCSSMARPDITKWMETKDAKQSGAGVKSTRIDISVTGGSIKTSSGTVLWDGTVPVAVPVPLLNVKKASPGSSGAGSFGHGIQWQGIVSMTSTGIEISGMFSYPIYSHGPIPFGTNYSTQWINGDFKLSGVVTSNNSDISQLVLPGSYESPIFFSEMKVDVTDIKKQFVVGDVGEDGPIVIGDQRLPVIISGSFSPDKTSFSWSGNATITIPSTVPTKMSPKLSENSSISGWFNVVGGNVRLDSSDGSSAALWSGELPVAIPLPLPYKVLMDQGTGEKLIVFGNGLVWSASMSGSSLEGSFSFPQFSKTTGAVSVDWLNGQFSLEVVPVMKGTLDELLTPGVKYTSRIILRPEPAPATLKLGTVFNDELEAQDSLENLVVESQEVIDGNIPAPLILYGTFSPDKTIFYFNGKVILAVKPTKPKIDKQLKTLKSPELSFPPWGSPKFGGTVNSGHVSVGLNGGSTSTIWSGSFPVPIPMPTFFSPIYDSLDGKSFLFGNGVIWSGTLEGSTIKGTFSLPQSVWSISGIKQQTWAGEFSFETSPLWNTTIASVFVPGAKYYSKIHFQGTKYEAGLNSLDGVPGEDPSVTMSAPIILQGSRSLDKKTFYWTGNFVIVFQNKPALMFNIPKKLQSSLLTKNSTTKAKSSIEIDVTSGTISAGFTGDVPEVVWSGKLPATIPFGSLASKDSYNPLSANVMWSGDVKDQTFMGSFAVPTYIQNGTSEIIKWWTGNFSFTYTTKWGLLLENYVRSGKKYDFQVMFGVPKKATAEGSLKTSTSSLVQFTQEAEEILEDCKAGKLILRGDVYSKPFYCYIIPFCSEKKEYYWSGPAILAFPDPPKNKTVNELKMGTGSDVQVTGGLSSQFGGQVVSGSVEGGITGSSSNVWWSGNLPVQIPTNIFFTNKTKSTSGLIGGRAIEWSGTLVGNTLKGSFSFSQLVQDFPVPSVQEWNGKFSFDIEPTWNTSLDGLIKSEVVYTSGINFQGLKVSVDNGNEGLKTFVLGADPGMKQKAPIILQGTLSPDGSTFLWSGKFIIAIKSTTTNMQLLLTKSKGKLQDDPIAPIKPVKPKTTASFTVVTGQLSATNGSEPLQLWNGQLPIEINMDMLNPTSTPGAGASITWTPNSVLPELGGSFSVRVFSRNGSLLVPSSWSGNFSMHYLMKWSGSLDTLIKPNKTYSCSVIFKDLAMSPQVQSPGYIDEPVPKKFVLGAGDTSGTPCTLILNGKSYQKGGTPFYCKLIPFMCSNKPVTNWFSFNGDAMLIVKPKPPVIPDKTILSAPVNDQVNILRRINTTVISGSIVAGPEPEYPQTLWSGDFPLNISLPVFWNSEDPIDGLVPPEDVVHAHTVIWSGSQLGPRIEGSFSLPQYSKTGMRWWTGHFTFLFKTDWGSLGDLDGLITSGVYYSSKIIFRDINSPSALLGPSQFDLDTSTRMPIILLGTYSSTKTMFYWSGNVIIAIRQFPWNFVNKAPNLQIGDDATAVKDLTKPKQRVGVQISSGSITNDTDALPLWSGSIPLSIPLNKFNVSKGVNVIWSASSLYPKFSGNYSVPQYVSNADGFKIQWVDGSFSFDLTPLWNTTIDVVELGKTYATVVLTNITKLTKAEEVDMYNSFMSLIMESAGLDDTQIGQLNLKGTFTPDNMNFTWLGEAWFYASKNKTVDPKKMLTSVQSSPLHLNQFGGTVYDGSITSDTSFIFTFSNTVWSGSLPVQIPFSAFWSWDPFFMEAQRTRGVTWTPTSVTDNLLEGSYSIQQYSWNGISTISTSYTGNFKFHMRPLWNSTLTSTIQPGVQYYSTVSFQGGPTPMLQSSSVSEVGVSPGIKMPIILQGTFSPDRKSFFWSGNFILKVKP